MGNVRKHFAIKNIDDNFSNVGAQGMFPYDTNDIEFQPLDMASAYQGRPAARFGKLSVQRVIDPIRFFLRELSSRTVEI